MRRRRRNSPRIDIVKVLICFVLLILIGLGTKVIFDQQKISSKPVANAGDEVTKATAKAAKGSNETAQTKAPAKKAKDIKLNKQKAVVGIGKTLELKVENVEQQPQWSSSNTEVATVTQEGLVSARTKGEAKITAKAGEKEMSCNVTVKELKQVALTFDDGPGKYTPQVLDILEKYNAHATFFVQGQNINETTKKYLQREVKMGCEIGNHTYSHVRLAHVSKSKGLKEIAAGNKAIKDAIGKEPTLLRPPYGDVNAETKKMTDMIQMGWRLDTEDWRYKDTERTVNMVLNDAVDGDVILMHEVVPSTVEGLERIVKGLQDKGFELLTIDEIAKSRDIKLSKYKLHACF